MSRCRSYCIAITVAAVVLVLGLAFELSATIQISAQELPAAAQATPGAMPAASTNLEQEKLIEETENLRLQNERLRQEAERNAFLDWLWSNGTAAAALVVGLVGIGRWFADRRADREKRGEERYLHVVQGLGADEKNEGTRVGAAVTMRTFLQPGYERFYPQVFNLAVGHLRLRSTPIAILQSEASSGPSEDAESPSPLEQALVTVFKEAYPRARDHLGLSQQQVSRKIWRYLIGRLRRRSMQQIIFSADVLDSEGVRLTKAYLVGADLGDVWMPRAAGEGQPHRG